MITDRNSETERLTLDASRWVTQLVSGEATKADAQALAQWRRQSPAHDAAFVEAARVWQGLERGGRTYIAREGMPGWNRRPQQLTRRLALGGGAMLAAASVAYAMVDPPLGLWPSLGELGADYRTATGEQRRVTVADVAIRMNTQTSIAVPTGRGNIAQIELIAGEASFTVPAQSQQPLVVLAGAGRMMANRGRFDVRAIASTICVTCMDGQVQVEQGAEAATLTAGSQLTYDARGLGQRTAIDAAEATAWQNGFVVFRSTPLAAAIAEINRYRPGRVVLLNAALKETPVSGRFQIAHIDEVLEWVEEAAGARARALPGGIVLLS